MMESEVEQRDGDVGGWVEGRMNQHQPLMQLMLDSSSTPTVNDSP